MTVRVSRSYSSTSSPMARSMSTARSAPGPKVIRDSAALSGWSRLTLTPGLDALSSVRV